MTQYEREETYYFEYYRYVDGIKSDERFRVVFSGGGIPKIKIYTRNIGAYKDATLGDFDDTIASKLALDKMKELYGEDDYIFDSKYVSVVNGNIGVCYIYGNFETGLADSIFVYLDDVDGSYSK